MKAIMPLYRFVGLALLLAVLSAAWAKARAHPAHVLPADQIVAPA